MGPYRSEFARTIDVAGGPVYVVFFTLAGAGVALDVVRDSWQIALVPGRRTTSWRSLVGTWIGGSLADRARNHQNRYSWLSYVTQAGIGLGLAREIAAEFPTWGPPFASLHDRRHRRQSADRPPSLQGRSQPFRRGPAARAGRETFAARLAPSSLAWKVRRWRSDDSSPVTAGVQRSSLARTPDSRGQPDEIEIVQVEELTAVHELRPGRRARSPCVSGFSIRRQKPFASCRDRLPGFRDAQRHRAQLRSSCTGPTSSSSACRSSTRTWPW